MPPNPNSSQSSAGPDGTPDPDPVLEILEELAPAHLHAAAWATCMGNGWAFGHGSRAGGLARFWKLDLMTSAAFNEIWQHAQPRCEALAGAPLKVIGQYANGHTFGLGGEAHIDTSLPGSFTLLYYVNPVWENGWDGETVFYDGAGEVALAVRPKPNRAVFFDSRILHNGRAPSRFCTELRVTVAYKLQISPVPVASVAGSVASVRVPEESQPPARLEEISRDGAAGVYAARIGQSVIEVEIEGRLKKMGETVRLPGFRPGKIPREELVRRYGLAARAESLKHLAAKLVEQSMPPGTVAGSCELKAGAESGDMEVRIHATYLPDLPDPDFAQMVIERLSATSESPEVRSFLRNHFKAQVLDKLDSSYSI